MSRSSHEHQKSTKSAYQNNYSTETALVKAQNDIAKHFDQKRVVVLLMPNMSSAFDVIIWHIIITIVIVYIYKAQYPICTIQYALHNKTQATQCVL